MVAEQCNNAPMRTFFFPSFLVIGTLLVFWGCKQQGSDSVEGQSGYNDFPLLEATIAELQAGMTSGELSSRTITEMYLDRILEIDKDGPELNAVIEINPDALLIAEERDRERGEGLRAESWKVGSRGELGCLADHLGCT